MKRLARIAAGLLVVGLAAFGCASSQMDSGWTTLFDGRNLNGWYKVGDAKENSPLMITTNFSLSYFIVRGEVENSKVASWLAVMDNEGLSVLTAWAAGKFTASRIAQFIADSGVEKNIKHKELIIPGYVAILSGALEEKLPGWKITVGPREANGLPSFLKARA